MINIQLPIRLADEMIMDYMTKYIYYQEKDCDIILEAEESQGLSTNDMPRINKFIQDEKTGQIWYTLQGQEDNKEYDFDDLTYQEKISILTQIHDFYENI